MKLFTVHSRVGIYRAVKADDIQFIEGLDGAQ